MGKDTKRQLLNANHRHIAKLLTQIEENPLKGMAQLSKSKATGNAIRIGVTGPPGAGKSTLIDGMIEFFRKQNKRVGVLAVDPTSPLTGGAVLGDRIRMHQHSGDSNVFIRSVAIRGGWGGVSAAVGPMARALEVSGFDIVIVESVGVGQTEIQVMNLTDATVLVLVPESGDVIQTLKAGLLEVSHFIVLNKSDRPGSEILLHELQALTDQMGEHKKIFQTVATKREGIDKVCEALVEFAETSKGNSKIQELKKRGELHALLLSEADRLIRKKMSKLKISDVYSAFSKIKIRV